MKTKTVRKKMIFDATPHEIYEILMDSKKHSALIGSAARISKKVGGKFEAFNGEITGKNIELVPEKKIVQKWRVSNWKEKDYYSTLTFKITEVKGKTTLEMIHKKVPDYDYNDVKDGWNEYYFEPMKGMVA